MQIKAECRLDFKAIKALTYISMYRKTNPAVRFGSINITSAILTAVLILEMIFFGFNTTLFVLLICLIVLEALNLFMYLRFPHIRYKSLGYMADTCNEYIFTENSLRVSSVNNECQGENELAYSLIVKIYETSEYLFLFQINNIAYIVDKSTLTGGTTEDIRNLLCSLPKQNYIICKY